MFQLKNIELYNEALGLNESLEKVANDLPRNTYFLANLLKKAAGSIPSDIAEGQAQKGYLEKKNYFWAAWNSIREASNWIEVAARQGFIDEETRNGFRSKLHDLSGQVQNLIRNSSSVEVSKN